MREIAGIAAHLFLDPVRALLAPTSRPPPLIVLRAPSFQTSGVAIVASLDVHLSQTICVLCQREMTPRPHTRAAHDNKRTCQQK